MGHAGMFFLPVKRALSWIVANKDRHGTWHSTQATVLALKALLAATENPMGEDQLRQIDVLIDDQVVHQFNIPPERSDVVQQFAIDPGL